MQLPGHDDNNLTFRWLHMRMTFLAPSRSFKMKEHFFNPRWLPGQRRLRVRLEPLVEELLHLLEQLHAVLLHDDGVGAFADFHVAFPGRMGRPGEEGLQHVSGSVGVPLRVGQEGGRANGLGVVQRLAGGPELAPVLGHAVGRPQHRRRLPGADRISGEGGIRPPVEPTRRNLVSIRADVPISRHDFKTTAIPFKMIVLLDSIRIFGA